MLIKWIQKITGEIVEAEENALDLTDVQFQMREARDLGYTPREIRAGVITAMKGEVRFGGTLNER